MNNSIKKEDYEEPRCVLCMDSEEEVKQIPIGRALQKADELYRKSDYNGAERVLNYWLNEAVVGNDIKGQYEIRNELMGLYRKTNKGKEAIFNGEKALDLIEILGQKGSISYATTLINLGTVYKAFNRSEKALSLFIEARRIYEEKLSLGDARLGGLYNNMGLVYVDLEKFEEGDELYNKALNAMEKCENGKASMALTFLNKATLIEKKLGLEEDDKIGEYIEKAWECINYGDNIIDSDYIYACEKLSESFSYYGYFVYENILKERIKTLR